MKNGSKSPLSLSKKTKTRITYHGLAKSSEMFACLLKPVLVYRKTKEPVTDFFFNATIPGSCGGGNQGIWKCCSIVQYLYSCRRPWFSFPVSQTQINKWTFSIRPPHFQRDAVENAPVAARLQFCDKAAAGGLSSG